MKFYITKYALTTGIYEIEATVCTDINPKMISRTDGFKECYHKPDWHETQAAARKRAETMRIRKIMNLDWQIKKLEQLNFA